ncbi:MAG: TetR/AcrR family transcriptional regulator [Chloroflexi bacterium]|nr:TetR/AcrR family transcriptional regulator [Chloroflexota bacterium]
MSPRPDVSEERTEQILDAASEVFAEKGFHDARMDDIASEAELSKGALYLYFKSKDAIITALLDRLFQREMRDVRALQTAEGSARERLERLTDAVANDVQNWLRIIPVAYEFLGLIFRNKTVQKAFRQYMRTYLALITPIIQQGIDNGEFRPSNAGDIAIAVGAIYEGTILLWVYDSTAVDVERHIRTGINLLLEGLKP